MRFPRRSGILLHPTSLPGPFGIGDFGDAAYQFVDYLHGANQKLWQVLPLGPTGYGDSPYQCFSAFAGNPTLISMEKLVEEGYLDSSEIQAPDFPEHYVDYGQVIEEKARLLSRAFERFQSEATPQQRSVFEEFCNRESSWLDDFAFFMALKEAFGGKSWYLWDRELAQRKQKAMHQWREKLKQPIKERKFWQFLFFEQWKALKQYCNQKEIEIIGDIPIYVSHDSADVWANPELFYLDEKGEPSVVAGVPPDYFSATGQLWGNPIYRWEEMKQAGFPWWIERFRKTLETVDIIRLDHFRGFAAYWEVPGDEDTAMNGKWVHAPGSELFQTLRQQLGQLPIIAENLGLITEDVEELREQFEFPGMSILQFAFSGGADNVNLPHNYPHNHVAYTGTHDNDTTVGWWNSTGQGDSTRSAEQVEQEKDYVRSYFATNGNDIHWTFIRAVMGSVADTAIFPLQDVLGLGSESRMNMPGRPAGNWTWRFSLDQLQLGRQELLKEMTYLYGRDHSKLREKE